MRKNNQDIFAPVKRHHLVDSRLCHWHIAATGFRKLAVKGLRVTVLGVDCVQERLATARVLVNEAG
jgi:hypothetical protein